MGCAEVSVSVRLRVLVKVESLKVCAFGVCSPETPKSLDERIDLKTR